LLGSAKVLSSLVYRTEREKKGISATKKITKGSPQSSCCGSGYWNVFYNSLLQLELTKHSQAIAFADDLMILTKGDTGAEAENYVNIELRKMMEWAKNNKLMFNDNKSCTRLMTRRRKKRSTSKFT
jgi:hypothetical protein